MLSRGLADYLMGMIHDHVKETEIKGKFVNQAYFILRSIPMAGNRFKAVAESYEQAMKNLTEKEQEEVLRYTKGLSQMQIGELAQATDSDLLRQIALETMKNPDSFVISNISKKCWNCQEIITEVKIGMDDLFKMTISPRIACPRCGKNLAEDRSFEKGIPDFDISEIVKRMMKSGK